MMENAARTTGELYLADIGVPNALSRGMSIKVGPLFTEDTLIKLN